MCIHGYKSRKVQTKIFCGDRFEFLEAKGSENCMNIVVKYTIKSDVQDQISKPYSNHGTVC